MRHGANVLFRAMPLSGGGGMGGDGREWETVVSLDCCFILITGV